MIENIEPLSRRRRETKNDLWEQLRSLGTITLLTSFLDELKQQRAIALKAKRATEYGQAANHHDLKNEELNEVELASLTIAALDALKVVALREAPFSREFQVISTHLLPVCLSGSDSAFLKTYKRAVFSAMEKHEARQDLAEWLNTRAYEGHSALREEVLRLLCSILRGEPVKQLRPLRRGRQELGTLSTSKAQAVCWTLSAIGLTTPEVVEAFQVVARRRDDAGATALTCLAGSGNSPQRDHITGQIFQDWLLHCAQLGRLSLWLRYPVAQWIEPRDFPLFLSALSKPFKRHRATRDILLERSQPSRAKSRRPAHRYVDQEDASWLLCEVAARYPENTEWQNDVWESLLHWHAGKPSLGTSLFLGSGLGPRLNTPRVIFDFLSELLPKTEAKSHHRSLVYMRLGECRMPRHIEGLLSLSSHFGFEEFWKILQEDALLQTNQPQYNIRTSEMSLKRGAWKTIFSSGTFDGFYHLEKALHGEQSGSTQASILRRAAFFVLPILPPTVRQLVEEVAPLKGPSLHHDDFVARTAAQQLVASQGTLGALRLLLRFGLTLNGHILKETADAINQLAVEVAGSGESDAVTMLLLQTAFGDDINVQSHHRDMAISALREISAYSQLRPQAAWLIAQSTSGTRLSSWKTTQLIEAVGLAFHHNRSNTHKEKGEELETEQMDFIEDWLWSYVENDFFQEEDEEAYTEPKWQALMALIYSEMWKRHPERAHRKQLIYDQLGLIEERGKDSGSKFHLRQPEQLHEHQTGVLSLLFLDSPDVFKPALLQAIEGQDEKNNDVPLRIALLLAGRKAQKGQFAPEIGESLCQVAAKTQSDYYSRPFWFEVMADYSPSTYVMFPWEDSWARWSVTARTASGGALASFASTLQNQAEKRRAEELALLLTRDGDFAVRRAAYRILRDLYNDDGVSALEELVVAWSSLTHTAPIELRRRAAEGAGWLRSGEHLEALLHDPEKCVRDVARKSQIACTGRNVADRYLEKILRAARTAIVTEQNLPTSFSFRNDESDLVDAIDQATPNNRVVLEALPYGDALSGIGEDEHIETLRNFSTTHRLPGHVFYWLSSVMKSTEKQWKDTTKKWPSPWNEWQGDSWNSHPRQTNRYRQA